MPIERIHHLNVRAPAEELRRLRDFYCRVLGLEEGPRPPLRSSGYWLYAAGDPILHLLEVPSATAPAAGSELHSGFDHVAFRCTDLDAMLARLRENGVQYRVEDVPLVKQTQVFFVDPAGIRIELNFVQ